MLVAVSDVDMLLELDTLYRWQKSLFPERPLFMSEDAIIGGVRKDAPGHPMAVVSHKGPREVIHFEARPSERLLDDLEIFLTWFNHDFRSLDGLIRAGLAHLWLVTLHPFSDGNGRVTCAVSDRTLAQYEGTSVRLYSMSAAIMGARNGYYDILEYTQKGSFDVTEWLVWFLETSLAAMERSLSRFLRMLDKARFWRIHQDTELNDRQRKVLNRLLDAEADEFTHGVNASKYKSIVSTSKATATRDLAALVELGCPIQLPGGGRSA